MTNKCLLRGAIYSCGLTDKAVAMELGISPKAMSKKMNCQTEFKASEIRDLIKILDLTPEEVVEVFFN